MRRTPCKVIADSCAARLPSNIGSATGVSPVLDMFAILQTRIHRFDAAEETEGRRESPTEVEPPYLNE
jgi:hypothetical protein